MEREETIEKLISEREKIDWEIIIISAIKNPQNQIANFEELKEKAIKENKGSEDLIGEDFELSKQNAEIDFKVNYDSDRRVEIDISEKDKWITGAQQILNLPPKIKNASREELVLWLSKKLRFTELEHKDKLKFLSKFIEYHLKKNLFQNSL